MKICPVGSGMDTSKLTDACRNFAKASKKPQKCKKIPDFTVCSWRRSNSSACVSEAHTMCGTCRKATMPYRTHYTGQMCWRFSTDSLSYAYRQLPRYFKCEQFVFNWRSFKKFIACVRLIASTQANFNVTTQRWCNRSVHIFRHTACTTWTIGKSVSRGVIS